MAIKVGGTTVIDDSRNLQNVGGLKTVGGTSIVGSGDISTGSTSYGEVDTYAYVYWYNRGINTYAGQTASGSDIKILAMVGNAAQFGGTQSGTWRWMGHGDTDNNDFLYHKAIAVRIS